MRALQPLLQGPEPLTYSPLLSAGRNSLATLDLHSNTRRIRPGTSRFQSQVRLNASESENLRYIVMLFSSTGAMSLHKKNRNNKGCTKKCNTSIYQYNKIL